MAPKFSSETQSLSSTWNYMWNYINRCNAFYNS